MHLQETILRFIFNLRQKHYYILILFLALAGCINSHQSINWNNKSTSYNPVCNDFICVGKYEGVEFNENQSKNDIAHQYSNVMCKAVGKQLKKLYLKEKYSKVDFNSIVMKTSGMGKGQNYVVYEIVIPFIRVKDSCDAMTAFDHSGGWQHVPELTNRKNELVCSSKNIVLNNKLTISSLQSTPEGLQEYWIQWQHAAFQKTCK